MADTALIIQQTKKWITDVVVGCNFCPFASKEIKQNTIHYEVETGDAVKDCLEAFLRQCIQLDKEIRIETSLLILPNAAPRFEDYLDLVSLAERLLIQEGYDGIYQVATFHPLYCFAGAPENDAANYTNRSLYPMLHLLREERIEQALKKYPDPGQIPDRNIRFAREKGEVYMQMLREACLK
jgi:hypothetical protein